MSWNTLKYIASSRGAESSRTLQSFLIGLDFQTIHPWFEHLTSRFHWTEKDRKSGLLSPAPQYAWTCKSCSRVGSENCILDMGVYRSRSRRRRNDLEMHLCKTSLIRVFNTDTKAAEFMKLVRKKTPEMNRLFRVAKYCWVKPRLLLDTQRPSCQFMGPEYSEDSNCWLTTELEKA